MATPEADVTIVGAGAAGMAAAIFAAEAGGGHRIVVLEGAARLGAKILVSGGGRCNVTHHRVTPDDYHGQAPVVRGVLAAFGVERTIAWFSQMGVALKREPTGKLFPTTDSAHTIVNALRQRMATLGVALRMDHRVQALSPEPDGWLIRGPFGSLTTRRLIMATGGRSLPRTGSDGEGWRLLAELGHTVTPTHQALVPLTLEAGFFHAHLAGLTLEVELSVMHAGKRIDHRRGSLLWTHFGVSGPVVMDASRQWVMHPGATLHVNLLPGESFDTVDPWLVTQATDRPRATLASVLSQRLPAKLVAAWLDWAGMEPTRPIGQCPREARRTLTHALTALPLPVTAPRGWNYAEVTAGGVPLNEVDRRSFASRIRPHVYLVGELLDCDGRIGGFNFQWAWATGFLAGSAASASLAAVAPERHRMSP